MYRWLALIVVAISLSGCLYRPSLQQGDSITQAELDQLKPNLSKNQVQQILGTPALIPVFELEQWNYTYAYLDGKHRDQPLQFKTLTLYFKGDRLQSYDSAYWHPKGLPKKVN